VSDHLATPGLVEEEEGDGCEEEELGCDGDGGVCSAAGVLGFEAWGLG